MEAFKTLVTPDGVPLRYGVSGARPHRRLAVLLHGMASNMTRWSEFIEHTALKHDWDLLRLDLRGHGESMMRGPIGMDIWSDDLAEVLDAEDCERALLIGHSLGAHLALHFAARFPTRVSGLALIDPVFPQALRGHRRWLRRLRPLLTLTAGAIRLLNALGLRRARFARRDLRVLDERVRAQLLAAGNAREFVRQYSSALADIKYFPVSHYVQELGEMLRPLPPPASLPVPILVLLSHGLTYTDPKITERLLDEAPNVERVSIDAYHWPLTERPAQVREAIEAWAGAHLPSA